MGKSSHHKTANVFRFQSFAERIANVNIDVIHKIRHREETPEEDETYFGIALEKWSDLNYTEHFTNFRREITEQVQTYKQLVHHEDEIVSALQRHLRVPESLALTPLLDLVVQLARDLQKDFYCHFQDFFELQISLLSNYSQDAELLEKLFTCLSYLFKFLWRYLVKDVEGVFRFFSTLLSKKYKEYIRNFAAESFAFLMRKVKDTSHLFDFMLLSLEENPDRSDGVGHLIFEMIKGVKMQFHSCHIKVFPILLSKTSGCSGIDSVELPWQLVEAALSKCFMSVAQHTDKAQSLSLWTITLDFLLDVHSSWVKAHHATKSSLGQQIKHLLTLMNIWVDYKHGLIINDANKIASTLVQLLKGAKLPQDVGSVVLVVTACLLINTHTSMSMESTAKLVSLVYKTKYSCSVILDFTKKLFSLPLFEKDVLPHLLPYCHSVITGKQEKDKEQTLLLITQLLLHKCPLPANGSCLQNYSGYMLDFGSKCLRSGVPEYLLTVIRQVELETLEHTQNLARLWSAILCLPHVRPIDSRAEAVKMVGDIVELLTTAVQDQQSGRTDCLLFLLYQIVVTLIHMQQDTELFDWLSSETLVQLLIDYPGSIHVLRSCDLYFTQAVIDNKTSFLSQETMAKIFPHVQQNLSSPYSQVRLLTLRIFSQFNLPMPAVEDVNIEQVGVFQICLEAEKVPLSVQDYRQKLMHLQNLEHSIVQHNIPVGGFDNVPLMYLLGNLFCNFKLLWKPLRTLISSHAHSLSRQAFWEIYGKILDSAASETEQLLNSCDRHSPLTEEEVKHIVLSQLFSSHMKLLCVDQDHPDFNNFRYQLWKAMLGFADKCEPKSRILSPLLFRFLKNEYYLEDMAVAPSQNLLKHSITESPQIEELKEGDQDDTVVDDTHIDKMRGEKKRKLAAKKSKNTNSTIERVVRNDSTAVNTSFQKKLITVQKKKRRAATGTLVVHLQLFAKFKAPKSLFMQNELTELYQELLTHRSPEVQKVAFDCVMTYKHPYLVPYQENFSRLLDEKTFKDEIVSFSVNSENTTIIVEHRTGLLPVLMRILYGMMQHKTGKDTTGKANANLRRTIVFRFLTGCQRQELQIFIDLVFSQFQDLISDDPHEKVKSIRDSIDLTSVTPLRKIQGVMNTIEIIFKKLGHLLTSYLPSLLRIIIGLGALCATCLDYRSKISPASVNLLKTLRQMTITRFIQFIEEFDEYKFSAVEIDAIFEALVWPQLSKLPTEGVYSPTPLLKLFHTWTKHPKYYSLLTKCHLEDGCLTPLPFVFQLLLAKDLNAKVSGLIMEMVNNLLMETEDDDSENKVVKVNLDSSKGEVPLELGNCLLMPHIPAILKYIQGHILELVKVTKKQSSCLELGILSRISAFVTDKVESASLVSLLIAFVSKIRSQETELDIMKSILNLVRSVDNKKEFFRPVTKLFSSLRSRQSRGVLCQIFRELAEDESMKDVALLVEQLNAWDRKRMDEPDYGVRLTTFQTITQRLRDLKAVCVDFLLPIIYNCCFFIINVDDMSLRDSSTHCLVTIVTQFGRVNYEQTVFKDVVMQNILVEIKSGLRSKSENARHDFVTVLVALIDTFPNHPAFADLKPLRDSDVEVDFFENIKHIQIHRRSRALRRLIKHLGDKPVRKELIMSYFMPIVTSFLLDDNYTKYTALQDVAVETISALCRHLPWPLYLHQLKYYLIKITTRKEIQKLLVRVIVAILEAFHFDLSLSDFKIRTAPSMTTDKVEEKTENGSEDMEVEELENEEESLAEDADPIVQTSEKQTCSAPLATRIHRTMITKILPQLHHCLTEKVRSEEEHKLARSNYAEDNEILRVPIALAMVKLLQKLPAGSMEQRLPGILIKVCNFLKSRAKDIRVTARSTLIKILTALGSRYFHFILMELKGTLKRGYQFHVLCFTVYQLLTELTPFIKSGDLDHCLKSLQEVFNEELFGKVAEEKGVAGITGKVFEAKSSKSFDSYEILARYVSTSSLSLLISPLKQVLETTHSHSIARKVQEVLKRIAAGIMENKGIDIESLMVFIHGLSSETLPLLVDNKKRETEIKHDPRLKPESCLLLPGEPPRIGKIAKSNKKKNFHLIVEFGLQLLYMCLKHSRLVRTSTVHLQMLDPFMDVLADCLNSKYVRISSLCLRCLSWLLKFPLPSLDTHITKLTSGMFVLLKNYAAAGAAKGDNLELITTCFKAVTVLVRDVKSHTISTEELHVLLTFCEEDIQDYTRQSTAFTLLKAILSRKLNVPEMTELMERVENMAISSHTPHIRRECRQVTLQYLLDYPLGKKIQRHLDFFLTQLTYELESGRESALEMLATIFSSFPKSKMAQFCGLFFVPLAAALVNDESAHCRKLIALAIKSLLEKLDHNDLNRLFGIAIKWFSDNRVQHHKLAAQLCGLFIEVESSKFEHHISDMLPIIEQQLEPGKYEQVEEEWKEGEMDHLLYNMITTFVKLLRECDLVRSSKWAEDISVILEHVRSHLQHPHIWVRLVSAQVFGLVFAAYKPEELVSIATMGQGKKTQREYLLLDTKNKMETLAVAFTSQLQSQHLNQELADQVIKNMVFVAKVAKHFSSSNEKKVDSESQLNGPRLSLPWLVRKLVREANHEAVSEVKATIKRSSVFKWIAAISIDFGPTVLSPLLHIIMPPLQREITDQPQNQDPDLKNLAQEVMDILKKVVGIETFTQMYADVHKVRSERKETRKRQKAMEFVTNPEIATRKKIKKNLAKKEAKKRKVGEIKGVKKIKKRKIENTG